MSGPTPARAADRNLLLGILALQMDFIDRDALIAAMHAWVLHKDKPLGHILREQGELSPERLQLLDALVAEHLNAHDNDPERSLAALSSLGSARQDLQAIADPDVQASLSLAGSAYVDPEATGPFRPASADERAPTADEQQPGNAAALRYRVLRPHARGGLGEVFVAEDQELHREVALKEIQQRHAHDPASKGRFLLEAEITGGLEHPGIVPVYGLGRYADGRPFYAMRFIKGDNLQQAIKRFYEPPASGARQPPESASERNLEFRQLLRRFIDVCNAMAYAHSRGVLHRDLKPGNVMLGKYGETLVVDWGLAKAAGRPDAAKTPDEATLRPSSGSGQAATVAGTALGTPAYMSPEQAAGRLDLLGPATDVYGLGATLYAVLTGRPPFREEEPAAVLAKQRLLEAEEGARCERFCSATAGRTPRTGRCGRPLWSNGSAGRPAARSRARTKRWSARPSLAASRWRCCVSWGSRPMLRRVATSMPWICWRARAWAWSARSGRPLKSFTSWSRRRGRSSRTACAAWYSRREPAGRIPRGRQSL
jgi:serine/threonine-protein kinase